MSVSHVTGTVAELIMVAPWARVRRGRHQSLIGIKPGAVAAAKLTAPALGPVMDGGEAKQPAAGIHVAVRTLGHSRPMGVQDFLDIVIG